MDPDTFFNRIKFQFILTLKKARSAKVQATTWIRFKQDEELVELAFNSRMTDVHNLSEVEEIVEKNDQSHERAGGKPGSIKW